MSAIKHFIKKGVRQAELEEYLGKELSRAGFGGVSIAKTPLGERLTIHAARPGIVIGRRGRNVRALTDDLTRIFGFENPQIEVKEVKNPELNAQVMAYSLVSAIERGVHRRRAAYSVLRRVINAGAKGCEIIISGKLTSRRSRHEAYRMGLVAKSGELSDSQVDEAQATAIMKLGAIGVSVSIMHGDVVLPDEIDILDVEMEEEEKPEEKVEKKEEKKPEKKEKPKKEEKEEEKPKKKPPVEKKKTDLDEEVEELSELIEKTPGVEKEEPKPKKKEEKKPEKKEEKKPEKKPKKKKPEKKPKKKEEPKKKKEKEPEVTSEVTDEGIEVTYKGRTYTFEKDVLYGDLKSKRGIPVEVKREAARVRGFKTWDKI
ncbi:MAG: 30S ribosomal protein S3 [Asgard group archaeon]|nr:30S ribosomal protein S3 [Asgard group archaeon]